MSGETRDAAVTIGLIVAFATLISLHVATVYGLARRRHAAKAVGAFFLPPLAPYWAFTHGMRARSIAWLVSAALYGGALASALR